MGVVGGHARLLENLAGEAGQLVGGDRRHGSGVSGLLEGISVRGFKVCVADGLTESLFDRRIHHASSFVMHAAAGAALVEVVRSRSSRDEVSKDRFRRTC